jgi:uncharacterized protein (TIGR02265 family)
MVKIAASTFEGLFIQALKVQGPTVDKLRAVGFDIKRMESSYSVDVWRKSLEVARLEYFPQLSQTDGDFQLGATMVDGFLKTIIGTLIRAAIPFLSADAFCVRLPRFFSSGIEGDFRKPALVKLGDKRYAVTLFGEQGVPWFTAGAIDAALRLTKVTPNIVVSEVKAESFTVNITWI